MVFHFIAFSSLPTTQTLYNTSLTHSHSHSCTDGRSGRPAHQERYSASYLWYPRLCSAIRIPSAIGSNLGNRLKHQPSLQWTMHYISASATPCHFPSFSLTGPANSGKKLYLWGNITIYRSALTLSCFLLSFHSSNQANRLVDYGCHKVFFSWGVNVSHHLQKVIQHQPVDHGPKLFHVCDSAAVTLAKFTYLGQW